MKLESGVNGTSRLRFTHFQIRNWRNFKDAKADLKARVFLVGPNASGKSNLLDVFRFLGDLTTVGGGLQSAIRRKPRGGLSKLRSLAARQQPDISITVRVGDDDTDDLWEYMLTIGENKARQPIVKRERVLKRREVLLKRPDSDDRRDPERRAQTHMEQLNANDRFRDLASFFTSVRYLHLVPQLVRDPDRAAGVSNDPFGGDFLEEVARTDDQVRRSRLKQILRCLKVAVPQLEKLEFWRDKIGTPHLRGKYTHWRPQGAWQNEDQLSDGTLRLLGLLWVLLDGKGPLLLEEPELSLHPEVVRYLPQIFASIQREGGRQVLLSTHSSDLLQDEGIGLDEVFLLIPGKEGTAIQTAKDALDVEALLEHGSTLGETVLPMTAPRGASQLSLFPK